MSIKMSWYMFRVNSSMKPPSKPEITTAFYMCTDRERFYWSHDIWCCFRYNWHNSYIFCYLTKYAITLTRSIYYLFQDAALILVLSVFDSSTSCLLVDSRSAIETSNCSYIFTRLSFISRKVVVCFVRYWNMKEISSQLCAYDFNLKSHKTLINIVIV